MGTKIEWCDATISPLGWGCYGMGDKANPAPCYYCYAHRLAKRNLRNCPKCQAFIPHWHPEQLSIMEKWTKPKRIFIQSMGDLFHPDIPSQRIEQILDTIVANNLFRVRHTYFFLTRHPWRYADFKFPDNCWLGTTKTWGEISDIHLRNILHPHKYLSWEPLLGWSILTDGIKWLIIGAQSGPGAKRYRPEREWVEDIIAQADYMGISIFLKNNLLKLYPDLPKRQEKPL